VDLYTSSEIVTAMSRKRFSGKLWY